MKSSNKSSDSDINSLDSEINSLLNCKTENVKPKQSSILSDQLDNNLQNVSREVDESMQSSEIVGPYTNKESVVAAESKSTAAFSSHPEEKNEMVQKMAEMRINSLNSNGHSADDVEYVENVSIGHYKIIKVLGKGSSAKVVLAVDPESGESVAIKIIDRDSNMISEKRIFREVLISSLLNHPHIVKLLDFMFTSTHFFVVFEYVSGRQLYDVVIKSSKICENDARRYFRQIVSAIDYIHRNSIVHRDLKIENILVDQDDNIRIIDFGLSNFYDNKTLLSTFCGSLYFAAPELLMGQRYCGPEIDIWSLGVVLYVMLCGRVPFDDESIHALQNKIKACEFDFLRSISNDSKDLILNMIMANSAGRYGIEQIKSSVWINKGYESKVSNYMSTRYPLKSINKTILTALSIVTSFQFSNVQDELDTFVQICRNGDGSLEQIYWSKKPTVSLYYLMLERTNDCGKRAIKKQDVEISAMKETEVTSKQLPNILQNFVNFILAEESENPYSRYFTKSIFKTNSTMNSPKPASSTHIGNSSSFPNVRKSYLKGFFKGIKVKNISSSNSLKKMILDIFLKQNIIYEANEKSYFCSYFHENEECYFKLTMYYNVILTEHYLVLNCLNSKRVAFRAVYDIINDSLKMRDKIK